MFVVARREVRENIGAMNNLNVKIYADGADKEGMLTLNDDPLVQGLTTNPTLMVKAGIADYEAFAKDVLTSIRTKPVSFEVFSDEFPEMRRQALRIRGWQDNVYVKIPVSNSRGETSIPLIRELAKEGVKLNVTAILTIGQVREVADALDAAIAAVVSVFAGRIADTGRDPMPLMRACRALLEGRPRAELLWASVREVLNIFQAEECGCDIVTAPHDILMKARKFCGMDLAALSLETVKMFREDATKARFHL